MYPPTMEYLNQMPHSKLEALRFVAPGGVIIGKSHQKNAKKD